MMLGWAISAAEATLAALLIAIGMGAAQRRVMTVLALWTARGAARDGHPLGWLLMTVAGLIALGLGVLEVIAYFVGK